VNKSKSGVIRLVVGASYIIGCILLSVTVSAQEAPVVPYADLPDVDSAELPEVSGDDLLEFEMPEIEGVDLPIGDASMLPDLDETDIPDVDEDQEMDEEESSACGAFMCLFSGGVSECAQYLSPYFAIEIFTSSPPMFDPRETLDVRRMFLRLCGGAEDDDIDTVNTSSRGSNAGSGVFTASGVELSYWQLWLLENEYDIDIP
jgi:hypothetical protein